MLKNQEELYSGSANGTTDEPKTENNATTFTLTFGRNNSEKDWSKGERKLTLNALDDLFCQCRDLRDEKDGPCYCPATLLDGKRNLKSVAEVHIAVFDIDGAQSIQTVDALLVRLGYIAFCYTTHSHATTRHEIVVDNYERWATANKHPKAPTLAAMSDYLQSIGKGWLKNIQFQPDWYERVADKGNVYFILHDPIDKLRVLIPLKTPIRMIELKANNADAIEEYRAIYHGIGQMIGLNYDQSCADPCRLFYAPSCPKSMLEHAWSHAYEGALLDWKHVPRVQAETKKAPGQQTGGDRPKANKGSPSGPVKDVDGVVINVASWAAKNTKFDIEALLEGKLKDQRLGPRTKGGYFITCPFEAQHTEAGGEGTFAVNANDDDCPWQVYCSHNACFGRKRADFIAQWIRQGEVVAKDLGVEGWEMPKFGSFRIPASARDSALAQFNERWAAVAVGSKTRYVRLKADGGVDFFDRANFLNLHEACKL